MKRLALAAVLAVAILAVLWAVNDSAGFDDEFRGTRLGPDWVAPDRPGDTSNSEEQCFWSGNVVETSGALLLRTRADGSCTGYRYSSAMVQWRSRTVQYGTIEVRAKLAGGKGTWPAIWLLGADCQQENISPERGSGSCRWPKPGSDEIDIAEVLNSEQTSVNEQIHSGPDDRGCTAKVADVSQSWHTYRLTWSPGSLVWQVDGITTCRLGGRVPSSPMFLIIDTAVGGSGGGEVDARTLPQYSRVEYVRVERSLHEVAEALFERIRS